MDEIGGLRLTESFSCWHPQPETSSPVRLPQSGSEPSVCAELSLAAVRPSLDEVRGVMLAGWYGSFQCYCPRRAHGEGCVRMPPAPDAVKVYQQRECIR